MHVQRYSPPSSRCARRFARPRCGAPSRRASSGASPCSRSSPPCCWRRSSCWFPGRGRAPIPMTATDRDRGGDGARGGESRHGLRGQLPLPGRDGPRLRLRTRHPARCCLRRFPSPFPPTGSRASTTRSGTPSRVSSAAISSGDGRIGAGGTTTSWHSGSRCRFPSWECSSPARSSSGDDDPTPSSWRRSSFRSSSCPSSWPPSTSSTSASATCCPIFPLLYLLTASVWVGASRPAVGALAGGLLLFGAVTDLRIHPEYLRYFNALGGGPENGHEILIDSNYDWGQDLYRLPAALRSLDVEGAGGPSLLRHGRSPRLRHRLPVGPAAARPGLDGRERELP